MYLQTGFADNIYCLSTPRYLTTAISSGAYNNFNLASYTGDKPQTIAHNRQLLQNHYQLPSKPKWLKQTHSDRILYADDIDNNTAADASWTDKKGIVCAVLSADCLPIFMSSSRSNCVAMVHAGYQGMLNGIIKSTVLNLPISPDDIFVHIGVGISQNALGLKQSVYQAFIEKDSTYQQFFYAKKTADIWQHHLNMPKLATYLFEQLGVSHINIESGCTYSEPERYFSFRRQGANSGRMASLIWFT